MQVPCQRCGGNGHHVAMLRDLGGRARDGCGEQHIVPCDQHSCHNGTVDTEAYYAGWELRRHDVKAS